MTDEQLKLAPCPFCGAAAELKIGIKTTYVMCLKCEAVGPDIKDPQKCVVAWNASALRAVTRPAPTEALLASQHLLETIHRLNTHGSVREYDWEEGGVGDLIANRISENRAALSVGETVSPMELSEAMVIAGARSIGNTIHTDNHNVRARECWNAMWAARHGIEEPIPQGKRAALPSEAIGREWQDISTAPRDGTKIDLLFAYPRGRQNDCQWRHGDIYGDGGWYWSIPRWGSQPGLGIDWHLLPEEEWETGCYPNMEPTHWMLPPAGPSVTRPERCSATASSPAESTLSQRRPE